VRKAAFDPVERKRLYKAAREYLDLRSKRKQFVREVKSESLRPEAEGQTAG
jgi:hypothetical protein